MSVDPHDIWDTMWHSGPRMFSWFNRRIFRWIGLLLGIVGAIGGWTRGPRDSVTIGWTIVVISWIIYEIWSAATDWPDRTSFWQFIVDNDDY